MAGTYTRTPTLVVALPLQDRPALMIGGGAEAVAKTRKLLDAGARVTLVAPEATKVLREEHVHGRLTWFARAFVESDLHGQHVVVLSERDPELAVQLRKAKRQYGFLLATVDQPATCDFYFTARVDAGPVEISLSSGGSAPLLLRRMREQLQQGFDERFRQFASHVAELRARFATLPSGERRQRLARALQGFAIEVRLRYPPGEGRASGRDDQEGQ